MTDLAHEQVPMNVLIRAGNVNDAQRLSLIGAATFLETFAGELDGSALINYCAKEHSVPAYEQYVGSPRAAVWLAEAEKGLAPIGYALVCEPSGSDLAPADALELKRIYAFSRFHGHGLGKSLLKLALDHAVLQGAKRMLLDVHSGNARAIAFYRRAGFAEVRNRTLDVGGLDLEFLVMSKCLRNGVEVSSGARV